jgi:hypothetical protein
MPAGADPAAARFHVFEGVELKRNDRSSASGSSPDNLGPVVAPAEVRPPVLAAGIEQRNEFLAIGIDTFGLIRLEAVASSAGEPHVEFSGQAAARSRLQMLEFKRPVKQLLLSEAIAAATAGLIDYKLP